MYMCMDLYCPLHQVQVEFTFLCPILIPVMYTYQYCTSTGMSTYTVGQYWCVLFTHHAVLSIHTYEVCVHVHVHSDTCNTGRIVNITDAQRHPQFFGEVDKSTGFYTKYVDLLHHYL